MRVILIPVFLAGFLLSCATTRYLPRATDDITLHEDRASSRTPDIGMTVAFDAMDWAPGYLEDSVVAFRVALNNYGETPVPIEPRSFLLFDGEGNQYAPATPEQLGQFGTWAPWRSGMGVGYYDPWRPWGSWSMGPTGWYDTYGYDPTFMREVFTRSLFPSSPLSPGAKTQGYVYFRGDFGAKPQELSLQVQLPENPPRRFPFVLVQD